MSCHNLKIAVYGAGAMGTVLGALLTKGGLENVDLITRNKTHVEGLRRNGATVVCEADGKEICVPVNALYPEEISCRYDLVFLMTKQKNNGEILKKLLPFLADDGVVCTTQNGLPESGVAAIVGAARTYGAATSFGANFIGGGKVALTSKLSAMRMEVGGFENDGEKTQRILETLSFAGKAIGKTDFAVKVENLSGARWSKLTINAAFSGLSVLTGLTFGEVARRRKTRRLALAIMRECIAVANARGIALSSSHGYDMQKFLDKKSRIKRLVAYMVLPFTIKKHKKLRSGMLLDLQNGRKCEIDYINGAVIDEGKKARVKTPLCAQVVEIVHGIENGLYEIDYRNADFFEIKKDSRLTSRLFYDKMNR